MKKIIISHSSALQIIRELRSGQSIEVCVDRVNECLLKKPRELVSKIDVIVDNNNFCNSSSRFRYHVVPRKIYENYLIKLNDHIYFSNVDLVIVQMSKFLSFEKLFLLVCEMCGHYSINPLDKTFLPLTSCLTSLKNLKAVNNHCKKIIPAYKGYRKIEEVLAYSCENSASPMEAKLYLKLCGPRSRGFYACKNLFFNQKIILSQKAKKIAGQQFVMPDISSRKYKVAIEYDSARFHTNILQSQKDKLRREAIVYDGWKSYTIIPSVINDPYRFHVFAQSILKGIGQSNRIRSSKFFEKRNRAFELLL